MTELPLKSKHNCKYILLFVLLVFNPAATTFALDVTFQWSPNSEPDLAGYRVFHRVEHETYDYGYPAWEGTATTCTIYDLDESLVNCFVARAYNTQGFESVDSVEVCKYPEGNANQPPVADAGPDQTVYAGESVGLNGSNSIDPENDIVAYLWTQETGNAVILSDPGVPNPTFTAPETDLNGSTMTFRLTVTDSSGNEGHDTCLVNVAWLNQPPTANAGPDQTVEADSQVQLNGSASVDLDDGIAAYAWAQVSGPAVILSDPNSADPSFSAPDIHAGGESLTFELTVSDFGGLESVDTCIVNLTRINQPPTANAGPDQTVYAGQLVNLNGSNSTDAEDDITAYLWTQESGDTVILSDPTATNPTFTSPGTDMNGSTLTFRLTVTDSSGNEGHDTCLINVAWLNQPPTAHAGPDQTVEADSQVQLNGSASVDLDDGIAAYAWAQVSGPAVILSDPNSADPSFSAPDIHTGGESLSFELTVSDFGGLQSVDTCIVNLTWLNQSPTANAGPDQVAGEGGLVILNGSSSVDIDDGIATYTWSQLEGPPVTLSDSSAAQPSFSAPEVPPSGDSLTFCLYVTDNSGLQDSDTCIVNITSQNEPPVAVVAQSYLETIGGAVVILDGSGSTDADDGIVSYQWTQVEGDPVELSDPALPTIQFIAPEAAQYGSNYVFNLIVTDLGGLQSSAENVVYVVQNNDSDDDGDENIVNDGIDEYDADDGSDGNDAGQISETACFLGTSWYQ